MIFSTIFKTNPNALTFPEYSLYKYNLKLNIFQISQLFQQFSQQRTKSGNHQLVIKLPIGEYKLEIGVFRIWDWGF